MQQNNSYKNSIRAQDDYFFRIQHIARNSYKELIDNSQFIESFERLCEGFTFLYLWDGPEISPETFQRSQGGGGGQRQWAIATSKKRF